MGIYMEVRSFYACIFMFCGFNSSPLPKNGLHPRSKHRIDYNFDRLQNVLPELTNLVFKNKWNDLSIDFSDPRAVKALNRAILLSDYNVSYWDFPSNFLCPPIPGRADYLHHIADLLSDWNVESIPIGRNIVGLDIGVGANAIYPLIGHAEYGWSFVGTDVNPDAVASANQIINSNFHLKDHVQIRQQMNMSQIFRNILSSDEYFDFSMCNPPFHTSLSEAREGTRRKWRGLGKNLKDTKNFNGQEIELCYPGGEYAFISKMITESVLDDVCGNILWFTTMVSKETNLDPIYRLFEAQSRIMRWETIDVSHGSKRSRIVAWTCLDRSSRENWRQRWTFR